MNPPSSKSHAFLIELIIAVLVFALCSAIVLGLFVKADQTSRKSQINTVALATVQALAEQAKVADLPGKSELADTPTFYFDEAGTLVQDKSVAAYQIRTQTTQEVRPAGILLTIFIQAETVKQESLVSLTVKKYYSGEEAAR